MHLLKGFLNKPYDLLESKRFRYFFVFGTALFALAFLWIFEPYGFYNLSLVEKIIGVSLYVGTGTILSLIHFFPLQKLLLKRHTVFKVILWIMLSFVLTGSSSSVINSYLYNNGQWNFLGFLYFQAIILSINIIPVSVFVLIHYNITLRKRLRTATRVNNRINQAETTSRYPHKEVVLNSESKNEGMAISLDSLLCINSLDNYVEVNYTEDGKNQKRLVRYSLSRIEQDNKNIDEIFRCHKSYIVNKCKIESVSGNAAGYKLKLKHLDDLIPVSRQLNKEIKTMF